MALATISGKGISSIKGFTFIELMLVLVIITMLISIALPNYFSGLTRSKETVLKEDLKVMRKAIDLYHADKDSYPKQLDALVINRYLHDIPEDPMTERSDTWVTSTPPDRSNTVYDVRSGSQGIATDGTNYSSW
jgi:general secretion pathway protein G